MPRKPKNMPSAKTSISLSSSSSTSPDVDKKIQTNVNPDVSATVNDIQQKAQDLVVKTGSLKKEVEKERDEKSEASESPVVSGAEEELDEREQDTGSDSEVEGSDQEKDVIDEESGFPLLEDDKTSNNEKVKEKGEDALNKVTSFVGAIGDNLRVATNATVNTVTAAAQSLKEKVQGVQDQAAEGTSSGIDRTQPTFEDAKKSVAESLGGGVQSSTSALPAQPFKNQIKKDDAQRKAEKIEKNVQEVGQMARNVVSSGVDATKETAKKVKGAANTTSQTAQILATDGAKAVNKKVQKVKENAVPVLNEVVDNTKEKAQDLKVAVQNKASSVIVRVQNSAADIFSAPDKNATRDVLANKVMVEHFDKIDKNTELSENAKTLAKYKVANAVQGVSDNHNAPSLTKLRVGLTVLGLYVWSQINPLSILLGTTLAACAIAADTYRTRATSNAHFEETLQTSAKTATDHVDELSLQNANNLSDHSFKQLARTEKKLFNARNVDDSLDTTGDKKEGVFRKFLNLLENSFNLLTYYLPTPGVTLPSASETKKHRNMIDNTFQNVETSEPSIPSRREPVSPIQGKFTQAENARRSQPGSNLVKA